MNWENWGKKNQPALPHWKPKFQIGEKVDVNFQEGQFKGWHAGTVKDIDYLNETYTVEWSAAGWEPSAGLPESDLRKHQEGGRRRRTQRKKRKQRKTRNRRRKN